MAGMARQVRLVPILVSSRPTRIFGQTFRDASSSAQIKLMCGDSSESLVTTLIPFLNDAKSEIVHCYSTVRPSETVYYSFASWQGVTELLDHQLCLYEGRYDQIGAVTNKDTCKLRSNKATPKLKHNTHRIACTSYILSKCCKYKTDGTIPFLRMMIGMNDRMSRTTDPTAPRCAGSCQLRSRHRVLRRPY